MAPYGTSLSKAFKIPGSASPDVLSSALPTILDSLHQKPMDADAVTASTELKPSEISINGTDSGYASAATSPDNGGSGSQETFTDCIPYPARRSFHRRVVQLRPFEMEISEPVQNRFSDLVELFEKPLYNHLARSQNHLTAISIKLKVLGASELTAKPWIVILCQHQVSPRVKQFFNQQHIKSEYQPHHVEDSLPSFGLVVFSRPPRSIAARISVKRSPMIPMNHSYYYGASIKVDTLSRARFATLGGLINVTTAEGVCTSYGMTAGHVAIQSEDEDQRLLQADASNDPLSSTFVAEVDFDGEEEFEIDENHLNAKESYLFEHEFDFSELLGHDDDEDDESWLEAGRIHANSYDYESRGPNLDWALLQVDDPPKELLLSNLLNVSRLKGPSPSASSTTVQMEVTLLTAKFRKFGWLSTASSFLRTGPARGFTKTYSLTVAGGSREYHDRNFLQQYRPLNVDYRSSFGRLRLMGHELSYWRDSWPYCCRRLVQRGLRGSTPGYAQRHEGEAWGRISGLANSGRSSRYPYGYVE